MPRPDRARRMRRGAALLEVLVALAILGTAGGALMAMLVQTGDAARQQHARERELAEAGARLDAVALMTRAELDARVGESMLGEWTLQVVPAGDGIYELSILAGEHRRRLLQSAVYRADAR